MNLLYKLFVLIILFITVAGSVGLIYLQNIDGTWNPPVTFTVDIQNLKTDKAVYKRSEPVSLQFSACKHRNYSIETTWKLVDHTVIIYPPTGTRLQDIGCITDKWFVIGDIPPYAVPGTHYLEGVSALKVNSLRTIYLKYRSADFQVI